MRPNLRPESLIGATLRGARSEYRVQQLLASGGIAHVYLAERLVGEDTDLDGDIVAIKLMRPELARKSEVVARFEREALAASRIHHENVLAVFEEAQSDGTHSYFACEHLVGVDLADVLVTRRPLQLARAVRVVVSAARGLAAGHRVGVTHRDVKPENLFLVHSPDGREIVKVIDFGTAWLSSDLEVTVNHRLTMTTSFVGTPGYMAPEQAEGAPGHPRADVYSLGVVLYETLSGRPPFVAGHWMDLLSQHAKADVPPIRDLPPALFAVVARALEKRPEDRFGSLDELADALIAASKPE